MFKVIKLKLEIQDRDRREVKPVPALCGIKLSGRDPSENLKDIWVHLGCQ